MWIQKNVSLKRRQKSVLASERLRMERAEGKNLKKKKVDKSNNLAKIKNKKAFAETQL